MQATETRPPLPADLVAALRVALPPLRVGVEVMRDDPVLYAQRDAAARLITAYALGEGSAG